MRTLIVAAGGGGDAITGAALAGPLRLPREPLILSYSWDRLLVDPRPGPRTAADFTGLHPLARHVLQVLPTTRPVPGAGSSLPRLAAELPAHLALLDPAGGAVAMSEQIRAAAEYTDTADVVLVDVGGDVLTDGTEPGLRSPLADQLALAACIRTGLSVRLVVAAPGIDGELPAAVVHKRLSGLGAARLPDLDPDRVTQLRGVFTWHPSEASGLFLAAARGLRGRVEVRDAGDQVDLTDDTPNLYVVDAHEAAKTTPAANLADTHSLADAEAIIHADTGISEIRYETDKARRQLNRPVHHPGIGDLPAIDDHAHEASRRGADFISLRRLSELLHATTLDAHAALSRLLAAHRAAALDPPIYRAGGPSVAASAVNAANRGSRQAPL